MITLLAILLPFSLLAQGVKCVDSAKIKTIINHKEVVETISYCIAKRGLYFLNKACHQTKSCLALEAINKKIVHQKLFSPTGSIPFKMCRIAGGRGHLAQFWGSNRWNSIGICSFGDGSFIGTEHLYKEIMMRRKR